MLWPVYHPSFSPGLFRDGLLAAIKTHTGLASADLATRFDSLGNDCEFGFVQRKFGAEPLGLFRFSNPTAEVVLRAIEADFEGFGEKARVELSTDDRPEWMVIDRENGLRQHTFIYGDQQEDGEALTAMQLTGFRMLRRVMVERIRSGSKIFVIKSGQGHLSRDIVSRIAKALLARGPNWLLWVERGLDVGRVDVLEDGLLLGTIDRLTVQPEGYAFSFAGWAAVLSEAWNIVASERASA